MDKEKMNGRELTDEDLVLVNGGNTDSNDLTCFSTTADVQIMRVMDCASCSLQSTCKNKNNVLGNALSNKEGSHKELSIGPGGSPRGSGKLS